MGIVTPRTCVPILRLDYKDHPAECTRMAEQGRVILIHNRRLIMIGESACDYGVYRVPETSMLID